MPVNNSALMDSATSCSVTGGSAQTFTNCGNEVKNGKMVEAKAVSDFRLRPTIKVTNRRSVQNNDGTWSKEKREATIVIPRLLDSGAYGYELIRIQKETYPDISTAERLNLKLSGAQLLFDADYTDFWDSGAVD